jgi:Peptidase family M28
MRALRLVSLSGLLLSACAAPTGRFQEANARAHISMLGGTIGSRPVGTYANAQARAYLVEQLELYGFTVRVQETDATDHEAGRTARVANILAVTNGTRRDAIALVAHYDSVPDAPGALDDALGVAVCLETARLLAAGGRLQHSLVVLLTDGEEPGLLGARAATLDQEFASRVRTFLNFDAIGASGDALLFEAGPGRGAPLGAWARSAAAPRGSSFVTEIYKQLPNETDFSVLASARRFGLNFSPVTESYGYHTARDVPERVASHTIRHAGENALTIVEALDRMGLDSREGAATFFDLAGRRAVVYGRAAGRAIGTAAILLALLAWVMLLRDAIRQTGVIRILLTALWSLVAALATLGAMLAAAWALRAARAELHPWYAAPHWALLFMVFAALAAGWGVRRIAASVPEWIRAIGTPAAVWAMVLPVWIALAIAAEWKAPAGAHLWTIPLAAAGALLMLSRGSPWLLRLSSLAIAIVCALFWVRDTVMLAGFVAPMFGRLPIVMPVWVFPVLLFLAGIMLAPPLLALALGRETRRTPRAVIGSLLLLATVIAGAVAYASDAYTEAHPQRRTARYVHDAVTGRAFWEVAGNEPGIDLIDNGPPGSQWQRVSGQPPTVVPLNPLRGSYVFRSAATPIEGPAPAEVAGRVASVPGAATELEISVRPRMQGISATFVLPRGVAPFRSSLAGGIHEGRWRATYIAPPAEGIALRAALGAAVRPEELQKTVVVLSTPGLPGGRGWQRLSTWLPQERTVWTARSVYVVPALATTPSPTMAPPVAPVLPLPVSPGPPPPGASPPPKP